MVENSKSEPTPPSSDDDHKVISEYLDSFDWTEQVRVARQKREEVLARKAQEKFAAAKGDTLAGGDVSGIPLGVAEASVDRSDLPSDLPCNQSAAVPDPQRDDLVIHIPETVPDTPAAKDRLPHPIFRDLPALGGIADDAGNRGNAFTTAPHFLHTGDVSSLPFDLAASDAAPQHQPFDIPPAGPFRPETTIVEDITKQHRSRQTRTVPVVQRGLFGLSIGILAGVGIGWMLQSYSATNPFNTAQSGVRSDANTAPATLAGNASSASDAALIFPSADSGSNVANFARPEAKLSSLASADTPPVKVSVPFPVPPIWPLSITAFKAENTDGPLIAANDRTLFKLPRNFARLGELQDYPQDNPAVRHAIAELPRPDIGLQPMRLNLPAPAKSEREAIPAARDPAVEMFGNSAGLTLHPVPDANPVDSTNPILFQAASYNVILHVVGSQSGTDARSELAELGIVNAQTVSTSFRPARAMVAYYERQDAAAAQKFAGVYDAVVMDLTGFAPAPLARTVEIYLTD